MNQLLKWNCRIIYFVLSFSLFFSVALAQNETNQAIEIGAIYNLNGKQAQLEQASLNGAKLAVDEINQQGGILGKPLKLVFKNAQGNPQVLALAAHDLTQNPNIAVIIGLDDNNMVMTIAPIISSSNKVFISTGASSPLLPLMAPHYLFLTAFTDNAQASVAAQFAFQKLNKTQALIMYDENMQYARGLAAYFADAYQHFGGKVIDQIGFHKEPLPEKTIEKIKAMNPPFIYLTAEPPDVPIIIQQLRDAGMNQLVMGGDSYTEQLLIKQNNIANNIYYTTHVYLNENNPNATVEKFLLAYQARYHQLPNNAYAALAYDTVYVAANAIRLAQKNEAGAIIQAMHQAPAMTGVTGQFDYSKGFIPNKLINVVYINQNQAVLVEQMAPAYLPNPLVCKTCFNK